MVEVKGNGTDSRETTQWRMREMMNDSIETKQWGIKETINDYRNNTVEDEGNGE